MSGLFELAFARHDHACAKHKEFAAAWSSYIDLHPWDAVLNEIADRTFEIKVRVNEPAPPSVPLAFSDWLATLRAALDNGLYAWAATASDQNPPPEPNKLQFPITTTAAEFRKQVKQLASLPPDILDKLERAQPYHSALGPESNLLFWLHELARTDRHRSLHIGLGRVAEHRVQIGLPGGIHATFDTTVQPHKFIDQEVIIARFTTSHRVDTSQISFNPGIGIDPEIKGWADFSMNGSKPPLKTRMVMTELYIRNHLENMGIRLRTSATRWISDIQSRRGPAMSTSTAQ